MSDKINVDLYLRKNLNDFDCLEVVRLVTVEEPECETGFEFCNYERAEDLSPVELEDVTDSFYAILGHLKEGHVEDLIDVKTLEQASDVSTWLAMQITSINKVKCPVDWYGCNTYLNKYRCPCGEEWEGTWSCACNGKCPKCNKEIEPYKYEEVF